MWLATQHGFYSIVLKEDSIYHIRARVRGDLENLKELTGLAHEIQDWPTADYRYRILVAPHDLAGILVQMSKELQYPNFKSRISQLPGQRHKLHAYHEIWATMSAIQRE